MTTRYTPDQYQEAHDYLLPIIREAIVPVFSTVLTHVSRSGLKRNVKVFMVVNGEIVNVTWYCAVLGDFALDRAHGIRINVYGFDAGYEIADTVMRELLGGKPAFEQRWIA